MVHSIRSGGGASSDSPARRRVPRGAGAVALRATAGCAALVALLFFAIPAQAEPEPESELVRDVVSEEAFSEPGWIPSIELGFDTFDFKAKTEVVSNISTILPKWTGTQSDAVRQLMFRIGGELMGPMLEDLPGRPRLFVQGGVQIRTFSNDTIFRIGKPFELKQPEAGLIRYGNAGPRARDFPLDFEGQGSQIDGQFQDPSWYAGLGVAFSVPIATNLLLYIKPSVQYSMEKIDLSGGLTVVDEPIPRVDPFTDIKNCMGTDPVEHAELLCVREFVLRKSRATASTTDHSIGAGLELELVLFKSARPIRVSLYAGARFMWLLSDSTTKFEDGPPFEGCANQPRDSNNIACFSDIDEPIARYSFVRDDFGIRGGGGLRFSWVGFD